MMRIFLNIACEQNSLTNINSRRYSRNYLVVESNYDFSIPTYPVQLIDILQFEKNNPSVSIHAFSLKQGK